MQYAYLKPERFELSPFGNDFYLEILIFGELIQWLSMVWDKIPMIWDIIDLANYSLDWHDDLTKSEHHGNSNVADTKN